MELLECLCIECNTWASCLLGLGGVPVGVVALEILLGVCGRVSWSVRS